MGDAKEVRFRVLGSFGGHREDETLSLGSPQQRLTLALLLAEFGNPVSTERLVDSIWGETPPATARKTLQVYVSHLRGVVGEERIETDAAGYRILNCAVDAIEFEELTRRGRAEIANDPRVAAELLAEALGLWMGPPYSGLEDNQTLLAEATRLEELRVTALESRIEADLSVGDAVPLIGELESLVREYPFRERICSQLMLALYRAGRQAEALRAFAQTRDLLVEELGIEPGPELWDLYQRILDQDPTLLSIDQPYQRPPLRAIRGYELRELASDGPAARVYRAFDRGANRRVAVKAVRRNVAGGSRFISAFEPTMQLLSKLDHPHILPTLDYWRDADGAYLVSPWMDGGSLGTALGDSRPWASEPALKLINEVGAALSDAHRNGVVHGAVKPDNVVFDDEGASYLADFPVIASREGDHVAPEVAVGESPTPRSDVYSLGLIIHELFTGTLPDRDESASRLLSPEIQGVIIKATSVDPAQRYERVEELQRALRQATGSDVVGVAEETRDSVPLVRNPYKGLRAFQETDAEDFYGREDVVELTLERIARQRLVAVVGPSGSGKSSLVKAGVLPRLREQQRLITEMYPGNYPFEELETALRRVAVEWPEHGVITDLTADGHGLIRVAKQILPDDHSELVLVIDQFEELFSLLDNRVTRSLFLDSLTNVVSDAHSRTLVIITLRADFFDRPLEHSEFGKILEEGVVPLTTPTRKELARAVARPARRVGLEIQPGLVSEIVSDFSDQPGGLPLMQFTLTEMVERGGGHALTLEDYERQGGIAGTVGARAEQIHLEHSHEGRRAIEQTFLRLVRVDEQGAYTRRRVRTAELTALDVDQKALSSALQTYAARRLLTFDRDPITRGATVEVAHESLLDSWTRLRNWIEERRDDLVIRRRLDAALEEWSQSGQDDSYLPTGSRLAQFEQWAVETQLALSETERRFIQAGVDHEEATKARGRRRRRWMMTGFGIAAVVAAAFGLAALSNANTARAEALAAAAIEQLADDPERSVLLALHSLNLSATPNGLTALHQGLQSHRALWEAPPGCVVEEGEQPDLSCGPGPQGFLHPDGRHVVTWTHFGRVSYWDVERTPNEPLWTTEITGRAPIGTSRPWIDEEENVLVLPLSDLGDPEFGYNNSVNGETRGLYTIDLDTGDVVDVHRVEGCVVSLAFPPPSDVVAEPALAMVQLPVAEDDPTKCGIPPPLPEMRVRQDSTISESVTLDIPPEGWQSFDRFWDISPDGRWLTFSGSDVGTWLLDTTTGEVVETYPEANRATLSRDAERILLYKGWFEGAERVEIRDIESEEVQATIPGRFEWIRFTQDQELLVGLETGSADVKVFDPVSGEQVRELVGPDIAPFILRFDRSSSRALVNYGLALRLWSLGPAESEVQAPMTRVIHSDEARDRGGVVVSGGLVFAPGYVEGTTGYAVYDLNGDLIRQKSSTRGFMSEDGSLIVETPILDEDAQTPSGLEGRLLGRPRLADARTGVVIQELPFTCSSFASGIAGLEAGLDCGERDVFLDITDVKFSNDLTVLAVDSISTKPTVFDLTRNEMIFHEDVVEDEDARPRVHQPIALSPDGSTIVYEIAGIENSLPAQFKAVDVRTGDTIGLGATRDMSKARFSEDGTLLYIADYTSDVAVFETDTWTEVARFGRGQGEAIADLAVSGDVLATVGTDDVARVWDVDSEALLLEVALDTRPRNVEFVDKSHILVTTVEGEVLVFTLDPAELKSIALDRLTRGLSEEECTIYEIDPCSTLDEMRAG